VPSAPINNGGAAGDSTVVAGVTGQKIRVNGYVVQAGGNTNVTFKSGSNLLSGPLSASGSSSGVASGSNPDGWFDCGLGESFIVNSSAAVQLSGHLDYSFVGTSVWTPANLGAALYGLYLPTPGKVWQNVARTIPATKVGDPVACLDDQSGNGLHLTQATPANQPALTQVGGFWSLIFDGVSDTLTRNVGISYGLTGLTHMVSATLSALSSFPVWLVGNGTYGELRASGATSQPQFNYLAAATSPTALALGSQNILTGRASATAVDVRVNGAVKGTAAGATMVAMTQMALASRGDGSLFLPGTISGAVIVNASLSDGDAFQLERWLGGGTGVGV